VSDDKPETPATPAGDDAAPPAEPIEGEAPAEATAHAEVEDAMSPEAIAKRVAALGEEDEADRIARIEEEKLAERRSKTKAGKKKAGLEAAASKKLAKIGTKAVPRRTVASAADADPVLRKTTQLSDWAKKNQGIVTGAALAVVVGLLGFGGYTWWQQKRETDASVELTKAVADERGRIGDPEKDDEPDRPKDPRPVFKTDVERRDSALAKYRAVQASFKGTGAAYLARLEEGSLLLDKHDLEGALAAFTDAKSSPLAQADTEVKGRAMEGLGLVHELKAQTDAANAAGHLEDALKAFRELENTDVMGFKELGMYHQARILELKGDKDKAKELLKSLHERVSKPGENHPFPYLEHVTDDRLRALDPTALPAKQSGAMGGASGNKMSDAQMKQIIEQLKKQAEKAGQGEHPVDLPGMPPPPAPAEKK
jgi:hypothetical protein